MMTVKFDVYGKPRGKERPRVTINGTYTPRSTKDYQKAVQDKYRAVHGIHRFEDGKPLGATIHAYYPIPKSMSKVNRAKAETGDVVPIVKPDLDNVAKIVLDALNGLAYKDDAQVVQLTVTKFYDDEPRVEIILTDWEA